MWKVKKHELLTQNGEIINLHKMAYIKITLKNVKSHLKNSMIKMMLTKEVNF